MPGAVALTDRVDVPAETEAIDAAAPDQHLVPVHAPRGYQMPSCVVAYSTILGFLSLKG